MGNIKVDRLEKLRQADIVNFTGVNNFDNNMELHENLLERVFSGVYDDVFLTEKLEGLSDVERGKVFALARKYKSLCFYAGDFDYWLDSIEGVFLSDIDLVCIKLLDNYDYLIGLAREGGENTLKKFNDIVNTMNIESSAIEYLRNVFDTDELLSKVLIDMAKEDSPYNIFSDSEKGLLLAYAFGNLYYKDEDGIHIISPMEEMVEIEKHEPNSYNFENIVCDIQINYLEHDPSVKSVISTLISDSNNGEINDYGESSSGGNTFLKK